MRTLILLFFVTFLFSNCNNEPKSDSEKDIQRLREELETKKKEITDKKEIARLEAELKSLEGELNTADVQPGKIAIPDAAKNTPPPTATIKTGAGTGTIRGSSVNMRSLPSVQSARIASFSKGETVFILEAQQSGKADEAILTKEVPLFSNTSQTGQAIFTLPKGKAVIVESYEDGASRINVSYQHPQKGKLYAQIDEQFIESIENGAWYKVKRSNEQVGWVYEQFIKIN
jgi:hypothetical protein